MNPVDLIYQFNNDTGLLSDGYSDKLESSMQIEEALEDLSDLHHLAQFLGTTDASPKHLSRIILGLAHNDFIKVDDVHRFDKALDAIFIAYGSAFKLGLTPDQVTRGLLAVCNANLQKLSMPRDEHGKLMKPADFVGPETILQEILNE